MMNYPDWLVDISMFWFQLHDKAELEALLCMLQNQNQKYKIKTSEVTSQPYTIAKTVRPHQIYIRENVKNIENNNKQDLLFT